MSKTKIKNFLILMGFSPTEGRKNEYARIFSEHSSYTISVNLNGSKKTDWTINWGNKIVVERATTSTFHQSETIVIIECVCRLLEKGYEPSSITLEKAWGLGHKGKGFLDILVSQTDGNKISYLMIECKTWGREYERERRKTIENGGQLFTYYVQEPSTKYLALYTSQITQDEQIDYMCEVIDIENSIQGFRGKNQTELHREWNKLFARDGVFNEEAYPYNLTFFKLRKHNLKQLTEENSKQLFYDFLELLRRNVVSDKPNAFNKVVNLFLCKLVDEDDSDSDDGYILKFQWSADDTNEEVLKRLNDLYKRGAAQYLNREITDFSDDEVWQQIQKANSEQARSSLLSMYTKLRLHKSQEFAFTEVYNQQSFEENCIILREVVQLFQAYQFRYAKKQQFLGEFFEQLLKESLKQESGQFFTPIPLARFICFSIPFERTIQSKLDRREPYFLPYLIDYACGSGHFLTEAMDHVNKIVLTLGQEQMSRPMRDNLNVYQKSYKWAERFVYGIDKDWRLAKTTKIGTFLNGDGEAQILATDGLGDFTNNDSFSGILRSQNQESQDNQVFDVVVANPPFSVRYFKRTLRHGSHSFRLFNLLSNESREIECLFVERTKQLLVNGGYAGIILPVSVLETTDAIYEATRTILLEHFFVRAIAVLGDGAFMATTTSTNVLFLERRPDSDHQTIRTGINQFFQDFQDVTILGHENPITQYIQSVWETIEMKDYNSLLQGDANQQIKQHELYSQYFDTFQNLSEIRQMRKRQWFSKLPIEEQKAELNRRFTAYVHDVEKDKMKLFLLCLNQNTLIIKSGNDKSSQRQFFGFWFSKRRGNEGLRWIEKDQHSRGITTLYNPDQIDDPTKVNSFVLNAFENKFPTPDEIPDALKQHMIVRRLNDTIDYTKPQFTKIISTSFISREDTQFNSVWPLKPLGDFVEFITGVGYSKDDERAFETRNRILTASNIDLETRNLKLDSFVYLQDELDVPNDLRLKRGDIFISMYSGSIKHVGKNTLILEDTEFYFGYYCAALRVGEGDVNMSRYIQAILHTREFRAYVERLQRQNITNLGKEYLLAFKIPKLNPNTLNNLVEQINENPDDEQLLLSQFIQNV